MNKTGSHKSLEADCACGATSIRYNGRILSMFLCTCTECQKITGTGHAAAIMVELEGVAVTGETKIFARSADSGATLTRYFCPACGTGLYSTTTTSSGIALLPAGLFGKTDWYHPNQVLFHRSHNDWDVLPDIPKHNAYRGKDNA